MTRSGLPVAAALLLAACARTPQAPPADALQQLRAYANASCLAHQTAPQLREQGELWAAAIIERSRLPVARLADVDAGVREALATSPMPYARDERTPRAAVAMPVMHCSALVQAPEVEAAISRVLRRLAAGDGDDED